jgi:hypothetical protein
VPIYTWGCWFFGGWVFWVPYRFWILVPYWISSWQRFSTILWIVSWVWWLFSLLCRSFLVWCNPIYSLFLLEGVLLRKLFPIPICSSVFPTASWSCFQASGLILRSLIHFELILVQGKRWRSSFSFLYVNIQFSQQHLLKRLSLLHRVLWAPLFKINRL